MKDTTKPLLGHFLDGFMSHIGAYLYAMIDFCTYPGLTSTTEALSFVQSVDDVVESYHSRVGFSRERMGSAQAAAFDQEAKDILLTSYPGGMVPFQVRAHIVWGFPKKKE